MTTLYGMQGMVDTVVRFSRCLYAQMVTQGYEAPRRYPLPLPSEPGFAAAQLGMKLVAGFEMLLAQASPEPSPGTLGTTVMTTVKRSRSNPLPQGPSGGWSYQGLTHIGT